MGSSKKQTVGFRYYLGMHFGLCHGPVNEVQELKAGDRTAWVGSATTNTTISVNSPELFGGDKKEGGVVGSLDLMFGAAGQGVNSYLAGRLGAAIPAFRGILSAVWRGGQVSANNPYVKPWAFRVERITAGWDGTVFLPALAPVPVSDQGPVFTANLLTVPFTAPGQASTGLQPGAGVTPGTLDNYTLGSLRLGNIAPWDIQTVPSNVINNTGGGSHDNLEQYTVVEKEITVAAYNVVPLSTTPELSFNLDIDAQTFTRVSLALPTAATNFDIRYGYYGGIYQWRLSSNFGTGSQVQTPFGNPTPPFRLRARFDSDLRSIEFYLNDTMIVSGQYPANADRLSRWFKSLGTFAPSNAQYTVNIRDYVLRGSITKRTRAMNPAHIVYECLTNRAWGMGYPADSIDAASFTAAATTLRAEGFGLCLVWNRQETLEAFIGIVLDHAGGILYVRPDTGRFALKLIRDDYDRDTLPQFGPSTLISLDDYQRKAWGETVNEITVVYRDAITNRDAAVTVQDLANVQTQGGPVSQTRQYPGLPTASLAQRVALRDLNSVSMPLAKVRLAANRSAWDLTPGDVFRLTWPDLSISDVVYRVLEVNRGTLQNGAISIEAVEDVFGLPANSYLAFQPGSWEDPVSEPQAVQFRQLIEAPYWELARTLSAADLDYLDPLSCYLQTVAARPSSDSLNYELNARVGAASFEEKGAADFCPTATLSDAIDRVATSIAFESGVSVDAVAAGGYALIGAEFVEVVSIDAVAGTATIARGLLDTVPLNHAEGARIWFLDGFQGTDQTEYAEGEVVDVKLLPRTGRGELALASAPTDAITMARRHDRPYPPGRFRINALQYPATIEAAAVTVSWAHRDRLAQTAYLVDQEEASIGPEPGTTYTVELWNHATNTLLQAFTGVAGTSQAFSTPLADGDSLRVELYSTRGGLASYTRHVHAFTVSLGNAITTEAGDAITTEAGDPIALE